LFSGETARILARPEPQTARLKRFEFAKTHYSWAETAGAYAGLLRGLVSTGAAEESTPGVRFEPTRR
jgi:hypothetical protein